jgi:Uma2 family endonuclease
MRAPDVSFIRWERFPGRRFPDEAVLQLAPDLAVEVLSRGNTRKEMQLKLKEYSAAGTLLVWYIDPERRRATIYTSPVDGEQIDEKGVLDGRDVLPGFRLKLKKLFAHAPRA